MAVKKILGTSEKDILSLQDFYDTQTALDTGSLLSTQVGTAYGGSGDNIIATPFMATKENLGSILGMTKEVEAFRKRRQQQQDLKTQGIGVGQSILGGSVV